MSCPEIIHADNERLRLTEILLFCLLCLVPVCASASGETRLATLLTKRMEYNDNILFSRNNLIDDMMLLIIPGLDIGYMTEVVNLQSGLSAEVLRYREHTELDNEYLSADIDAGFSPTERIRMDAGGSVLNDTTLDTELEETGILVTRKDRETLGAFGEISYNTGEGRSVSMEYSFARVDYDSEQYMSREKDSISLTYLRRMRNIKDAVYLRPFFSRNDSDSYRVESKGIYAGWTSDMDEILSLSAFLGARHTSTYYLMRVMFPLHEKKWGWLMDLSLERKGENWGMDAGLSRDLSYSVYGDPIETDRFRLEFSKNFTERLSVRFYGVGTMSESASELSECLRRDSWHVSLGPSLRFRISKDLYMDAGYNHSYSHDRLIQSPQAVERNMFIVSLSYGLERRFD